MAYNRALVHTLTGGKCEFNSHTNWNFIHEMKPSITLASKTSKILKLHEHLPLFNPTDAI